MAEHDDEEAVRTQPEWVPPTRGTFTGAQLIEMIKRDRAKLSPEERAELEALPDEEVVEDLLLLPAPETLPKSPPHVRPPRQQHLD